MSYQGLIKTNDAMALGLSVGYDSGLDYKKVNTTMLIEKTSYHIGGKLLQPMIKNFIPQFLRNEGDFLYFRSNQEHITTALLAGTYNYFGKNNSLNKSMMAAVVEGGSSFLGDQLRRSLSQNPNIKLKDDLIL